METAVVPAPVAAVPSDGAAAGPGFQASPAGSAGQRAKAGRPPARLRPRGGFGGYLHELRRERGLTSRQLAAAAGVHHTYVSKLERGDRQAPDEPVVEALAAALGVSPAQLDQLRWRAGLTPHGAGAPGQDDPTLTLVAEALANPALTDPARDQLRRAIAQAVQGPVGAPWPAAGEAYAAQTYPGQSAIPGGTSTPWPGGAQTAPRHRASPYASAPWPAPAGVAGP